MRQTVVTKIDDLTEKPYEEGETLTFAFAGKSYEIDLNKRNAAQFRKTMARYMNGARPVRGRGHKARTGDVRHDREEVASVRAWARENGHEVADRGRVPESVWDAYREAN